MFLFMRKNNMDNKTNYDEEPVYYCKKCNSLKILEVDDVLYCAECGSTEIDTTNIYDWQNLKSNKNSKNL